ncbi:hypothetical protein A10D4_07370 [Idiomarina xiamenensis 10-D-4]|uniref:Uncharacterized protein n=1 Tax=Idiomarina xiamenensis 10-D-4 TaxID=740709 RepID=K2KMI1_9GAMM|nr:hypothetical protein A10D4_07370 [Idiomarina xiamenensis 10-D-4]
MLIVSGLLLTSGSSFANNYDLPSSCEYGRVKPYDVSVSDLASAIKAGYNVYTNPSFTNYEGWASLIDNLSNLIDSFDYLRVEVPKHVIKGQNFRAKGNLFDTYANIRFHNSEKGYVGTDKSNLEANAYHDMRFDYTHGYGLVWVDRQNGICSAEGVWVQNAPKLTSLTPDYQRQGNRVIGEFVAQGTIDPYSVNGREGRQAEYLWEIKRTAVVRLRSNGTKWCDITDGDYASWEIAKSGTSNRFGFDYYACPFHVRVSIRDGKFTSPVMARVITDTINNGGGSGGGTGGGGGSCNGPICDIEP